MGATRKQAAEMVGATRLAAIIAITALLGACGGPRERDAQPEAPDAPEDISRIPDAVPKAEPRSKQGNPPYYELGGQRYYVMKSSRGYLERGIASWYGKKFHGRRTSNGEVYNMYAMSAAHKTLPLPTYLKVRNLENGKEITIRVNDRGPFHENRIIDLSYTAASKLGIVRNGTGYVELRAIDVGGGGAGAGATASAAAVSGTQGAASAAPGSSTGAAATAAPAGGAVATGLATRAPGPVKLYLQLGAFAIRDNAVRLAERIEPAIGRVPSITRASSEGREVYRVRLGPLDGVEQADRLTRQIGDMGLETPQVVIE